MRAITWTTTACLLPMVTLAVGCGGGERQDKNEAKGKYALQITQASFPPKQSLSEPTKMKIVVKNNDSKAAPDVAVSVSSFSSVSDQVGLADSSKPVWIVDSGPVGGDTAYVSTWALGRLAAGASKTFTWNVTSTQSGTFKVKYKVSPGLNGNARLKTVADGHGEFTVRISDKPAQARVDPDTGKVVRGESANAEGK